MKLIPALALALLVAAAIASAAAATALPAIGCAVELVAMSTCLPHVAAPPNNPTPTPSAACCATFFSALDGAGGGATCLCHLVREPSLLGFPLNASRIVALFSTCGASDAGAASSFAEICKDAPTLPPLRDAPPADTVNQRPDVADAPAPAPALADPDRKPDSDLTTVPRYHAGPEMVISSAASSLAPVRSSKSLILGWPWPVVLFPFPVFIRGLLGVL